MNISKSDSIGLIIKFLIELVSIIVKVMDKLKIRLMAIADLQHRPQLLSFRLGKTIVNDITSH